NGHLIGDSRVADILEDYHRLLADETEITHADRGAGRKDVGRGDADREPPVDAEDSAPVSGWGTRDVIIDGIQLIDAAGRACTAGLSGKPLTIRLDLYAKSAIESPNIGVGIRTTDGTVCLGSNMRLDDVATSLTPGHWVVDYSIDALPLREGRFEVNADVPHAEALTAMSRPSRATATMRSISAGVIT
ncbi:MAG: hypothetical protein EB021_12270, partial [Gammaproteobacteria bacterium]|nr:hypothetical protein [Gammaproteobacteria bacterium]